MRNFKKMLVVICVFALLTVGCVLLAHAADNAGTVADLNKAIGTAEAAENLDDRYSALLEVADYLASHKMDTSEAGYDDAVSKAHGLTIACAVEYLTLADVDGVSAVSACNSMIKADKLLELYEYPEDASGLLDAKVKYDAALVRSVDAAMAEIDAQIETTLTTAKNKVAINRVNALLNYCTPYGDTSLEETKAALALHIEAQERAEAINYASLDNENLISDYSLPIYFEESWEDCSVGMTNNALGGRWTVDLKGIKNQAGIEVDESGNKYYVHRYLEKDNPQGTYVQITLAHHNVQGYQPFVIEFDIASFGEFPGAGVQIEPGGYNAPDGSRIFPPNYFDVKPGGNITTYDGTVILPDAFAQGEWLHVVIVFEPVEFVYKVYVEGEYLGTTDAKHNGTLTYDHSQLCFRLSGKTTTFGEIAYDNIKIYGGSAYRDHGKFDRMTDDEKFLYYVDYLLDDSKQIMSKNNAYNYATELLPTYWTITNEETGEGDYTEYAKSNEALMSAVDGYHNFDIDLLIKEVKSQNLDKYVTIVDELAAIERSADTVAERNKKIMDISSFVSDTEGLIDQDADKDGNGTPDYTEAFLVCQRVMLETERDDNAALFIRYISRFEMATSLSAKERYYGRANTLVNNEQIDVELIENENAPGRENFADLIAAYEIYLNADAVVYELVKENNSLKIVRCIGMLKDYVTEEDWLNNREVMEKYLYIVKPVIEATDENGEPTYNEDYEGLKEAVEYFREAYAFFYALLQDEHVVFIQTKLDLALATEGYIDKIGYVSQIDRYINANEIDYTDERIISLMNDLDTCKSELKLREEDYSKILVQNAVYFVNLVEKMRTSETYGEQREYFEQASLLYFYLDATVEGAAKAVEIYDEYKIKLDRIAESSIKFIETVAIYNACQTEDEKYAALVECYYNAQFVEMSYDGAKEAMAEYQAAYDAYMSYAEAVNDEVVLSGNAVGSFRANCGIVTVIAVIIKKIFGV